jgi:hypothetical protein
MGRNILAVIVGYIALVLVVMICLTGAYLALGADRAFQDGSYEVTPLWIGVWAPVSFGAALIGGITCAKVSKHSKGAVLSLMILIGVLGAGNVIYRMTSESPSPEMQVRSGDVSNFEAMQSAQAPAWMYLSEPIIGLIGVMLGATLVCPKHGPGASDPDAE